MTSLQDKYAHGTLAGFVEGCRCICCAAAFADYISDKKNLIIFAPNHVMATNWANRLRLPNCGYHCVTKLEDVRYLRGRTNGYYVVLGEFMPSPLKRVVESTNLKELSP